MTRDEALQLVQNNEQLRKFLNVLAISEGTYGHSNPYLAQGGTSDKLLSTGYQAHPRALGQGVWQFKDKLGRQLKSTANGKYAITYPTWQGIEKQWGKMDFSPASQDAAAVWLINQSGALQDVLNQDWNAALPKLGKTWASLPTAPDSYQQFRHTWDGVKNAFQRAGLSYNGQGGSTQSQATQFAQTRAPILEGVTSAAGAVQNNSPTQNLISQVFSPPKANQFSRRDPQPSGEPLQFKDIQWLFKPTGMYGS